MMETIEKAITELKRLMKGLFFKGQKKKIKEEDKMLNALRQWRVSSIQRHYYIWKESTTFQKHKRKLEKLNKTPPVSPPSGRLAELLKSKKRKNNSPENDDLPLSSLKSSIGRPPSKKTKTETSDSVEIPRKRPKIALTPGILGLRNLGNTCYLNSILQVLGHLLPFTEFFLRLNISGFSNPPQSPTPLNKHDVLPVSPLSPLATALEEELAKLTAETEESMCSSSITSSIRKRRIKRMSTSECYQLVSRKTCNGLEGGSTLSSVLRHSIATDSAAVSLDNSETCSEVDEESSEVVLSEELHALLRVMWAGKHHLVAPFGLLHSVWKTIPFLRGHAQQDAQEFLQVFLDRIERELIGYSPSVKYKLEDLFYGEIASEVSCLKCNSENKVLERFSDLPLEFPERFQSSRCSKMESCNVYEMLAQFTNTESLGRVYSCEFCKSNQRLRRKQILTDAEKRLVFTKLPLILTVHFKRFRWFGRTGREKINAHVDFPFELDLSEYMGKDLGEHATYTLQAVVRHHGSGFTSGHYTAYCWNYTSQFWVHFNDAKPERCTEDDIKHTQAYILFYVKRNVDFQKLGFKVLNIVENSN